jgi:hypothetical protein
MPSSAPRSAHLLTDAQVLHYRTEGWTKTSAPVFDPADQQALVEHFDGLLAALPPGMRPEQMDVPHFHDPGLMRWLLHERVLDLVEPLIGPDIALFSSHFLCKPAGDGQRVPWHEDSAYWGDMFPPEQMNVVTVWLALDRSDAGNAAMRVIPRTHLGKGGYSDYEPVPDPQQSVFATEIRRGVYDAKRAVTIELEPGHASLHHAKLMHGSDRNTSDRRRCGYTMRYVSARTRFNHARFGAAHQCYLARGTGHPDNVWGDPTQPARHLIEARPGVFRKGH